MNRQAKGKLATMIAELESLAVSESRAAKRHDKAGDTDYAEHAAWCVEGINEAIMLLTNRFTADALNVLKLIVESTPGSLTPWKVATKVPTLAGPCAEGLCNHEEHL